MSPEGDSAEIIASLADVRELLTDLATASRVAVDLEASGMFAYRARICTLQLAWAGTAGNRIAIIDALTVPLESLGELLGRQGPTKIVHDVAFDARLLAESGIELANVHDTALAAHLLGRTSTGLATLLETELGVRIKKDLQQHDWRLRPLDPNVLSYLATDVAYLEVLERVLWSQVIAQEIEAEVLEETEYRLSSALAAVKAPQDDPPYLRVRGMDRLVERELVVLRAVAGVREQEAIRRDVPPYKVAPNEALIALSRTRPTTEHEVERVRGISTSSPSARAFVSVLARAIASAGDCLPDDERVHLERPRVPAAVSRARRQRESRLLAWRREEATRRAASEQVVLPGHCVKDASESEEPTLETLSRVRGIGEFRIARYGAAILNALCGNGVTD